MKFKLPLFIGFQRIRIQDISSPEDSYIIRITHLCITKVLFKVKY